MNIEGNSDDRDTGYWFVDDEGEEYEVLFHALFREEQKLETLGDKVSW